MNAKSMGIVLSMWLAAAGVAAGQASDSALEKKSVAFPAMYEDIEVFRRLLLSKLQNQQASLTYSGHAGQAAYGLYNNGYLARSQLASGWISDGAAAGNFFVPSGSGKNTLGGYGMVPPRSQLDLEGVYFKGQGVIFTVTMAPSARDPLESSTSAPVKPLSDWDRVRREVRGEKVSSAEPSKGPRSPGLAEVVLKTMAANGRHFRELQDNEMLTVVVTFRGSPRPIGIAIGTGAGSAASGSGALAQSTTVVDPNLRGSSARDYELIGDLHQKQGKPDYAVTAYSNALKEDPGSVRNAGIYRKLAMALLALGKYDDAEKSLAVAKKWAGKQPPKNPAQDVKPASAKSRVPSKLIISASKSLLDQAGAGKITFEGFRKAATVEYPSFAQTTR